METNEKEREKVKNKSNKKICSIFVKILVFFLLKLFIVVMNLLFINEKLLNLWYFFGITGVFIVGEIIGFLGDRYMNKDRHST